MTVRGRSGAVLLLHPLPSEKSECIISAMEECFTAQQLNFVKYVATDSPSAKFHSDLKRLCPNLKAVMLDPVHLAIVYEYGHWNKRTPGSKALRSILKKTCAVGDLWQGGCGSHSTMATCRGLWTMPNNRTEI